MLVKVHYLQTFTLIFKFLVVLVAIFVFSLASRAQGSTYDFRIYFPVDDSRFNPEYLENTRTLARIDSIVAVHGTELIDSVKVVAYSSPEGNQKHNLDLAEARANSMRRYLESAYPDLLGRISTDFGVSPWPEKRTRSELVRLRFAAFRLSFPYAIHIPVPELDFDIDESFYVLDLPEDELAVSFDAVQAVNIPSYVYEREKVMIAAVKTNVLYDLLTAYNVEIEVPIADRFSVLVEDVFPWWETSFKYCLQMWEMGAEARYWFRSWDPKGTDKLLGFFAGIYGMSSKYDLQWISDVDYQGEYWSAGVTGGWTTALGREKWANLELSLGLGYLQTDYRSYLPTDAYDKLIRNPYITGRASYFGPTKLKVSIVVPIRVNRKKEVRYE